MSAASLAYELPKGGSSPVVQIDVGSFIALMNVVAKHANLTSFERQLAVANVLNRGKVTAMTGARAEVRPHWHAARTVAEEVSKGPEVSLVNMLVDLFAPAPGKDTAEQTQQSPSKQSRIYPFGKTWLHADAAKLVDSEGRDVPLTAMEFRLLKHFAENRGRVLNRDQILEGAHDRSWDPFDRSIDIRISRIRKKIERNPQKPEVIRTVRGIGYIYDPA